MMEERGSESAANGGGLGGFTNYILSILFFQF